MRRDVRMLGDVLGEVIRDSAGPELLADVERLRRAVIDARHQGGMNRAGEAGVERGDEGAGVGLAPVAGGPVAGLGPVAGGPVAGDPAGDDPAGDEIAKLVASWSLTAAEQVARAFTVYFHLANLAEEHQRIRILRERDSGQAPVRESLAAAVAEVGHDGGPGHLAELLAGLRVHLVLTAHPTEARRRAVVAALRRISGLLDILDDRRAGAADHAEARRGLREQIDLLWRTSQLRVKAMDPIDEVRTVMTAFDETLFRVVPAVYRELDRALAEAGRPEALRPEAGRPEALRPE
ncbi:MAG: phosphoenolpyruvate carboxylase, partial [Streptosporangiaceae bacterium]